MLSSREAKYTDSIDKDFICLDQIIADRIVTIGIGKQHVIYAKEDREQSIIGSPRHIVIDRVVQEEGLRHLLLKRLHDQAVIRCHHGWVDRGTTVSEVICLNVTSVVRRG